MKSYDSETLERFDRGEVDYIDAISGLFDSGPLHLFIGQGQFSFMDADLGELEFHGAAGLLSIELPGSKTGLEAEAVTVRLAETYVPQGSEVPVNVFDDGVRASIDEEQWQWREALLHVFWRAQDGSIIHREQVGRRLFDAMRVEVDEGGTPRRVATLELPTIVQRDVEGKTHNAEFQKLIDPTDKGLEHAGTTARQKFQLGGMQEQQQGTSK